MSKNKYSFEIDEDAWNREVVITSALVFIMIIISILAALGL